MRLLYIIRGLPGAGKSTLAYKLTDYVCEADQFFMGSGSYNYDPSRIKQAHESCQYQAEHFMQNGIETIAVSNTFVKRWQIEPYLKLALKYGYTIQEIVVKGKFQSVHNVPTEQIRRMESDWEN